jgi:hypothetical protein
MPISNIKAVNDDPKPFKWTKSADDILAASKRFCPANLKIADAQNQYAPVPGHSDYDSLDVTG